LTTSITDRGRMEDEGRYGRQVKSADVIDI
jgi:hypothetical protein